MFLNQTNKKKKTEKGLQSFFKRVQTELESIYESWSGQDRTKLRAPDNVSYYCSFVPY